MPRVSVIVPAYNAGAYLTASLESVFNQTYEDWEIIVVDDGSSDNTAAVVASYASQAKDKIQYIYQCNRGLPAARNTAIRAARGELIALLDADDVWLPARLERSVREMDRDSEVGLVHARVARIDKEGMVIDQPFVTRKYLSGRIAHYIYTRRAHIMCPTVTFRKRCVDCTGLFDETMRATEDRDLWFRIAHRFKVAYVDEILAYYRLSPTSMSRNMDRMLTSQLTFVEKHYRTGVCSRWERLQARGVIYRECGDFLFNTCGVRQAIGFYLKSTIYNPVSFLNIYMLLRALVDPVLPNVVKSRGSKRHGKVICVKVQ